MYDQSTSALIRSTPALDGLDRENLPDILTEAFAQIAAARVRFRQSADEIPEELQELVESIRRLAFTNEALVSVVPEREDRSAAAFVAATAHQLSFNADLLLNEEAERASLGASAITSDVAAMLLFLVAEASADAAEISRAIRKEGQQPIESSLIASLCDLAAGNLVSLIDRPIPDAENVYSIDFGESATRALYLEILRGVHALAHRLLGDADEGAVDPIDVFRKVRNLSVSENTEYIEGSEPTIGSAFAGPCHLASLMIAVSKDLIESAVSNIPPPDGVDQEAWQQSMRRVARNRPYLWRNHRDAIEQGYLSPGTSAAVGFPTGAGKSTLAELKINATLLLGKSVIFLCPTHALVEQTASGLRSAFPTASVQGERQDEFGFASESGELAEVFVMTPEACLAQMSIEPSVFEDVGLMVFDECHLLHPSDRPNDRRAIDAMLCILILPQIAEGLDFLLLSAMMKNTNDIAEWISELTDRPCLSLSLAWKPTRQLRGSVVYRQETIDDLETVLRVARRKGETKAPGVNDKRQLNAAPLALFSLKQTWATTKRNDYTLVQLLDETVQLSGNQYWKLTPNAVAVSSAVASAAVESGIKTLVFFQTIKNAASAAKKMSESLGKVSIKLLETEARWAQMATLELGGPEHLYMRLKNGRAVDAAAVHHGLLLPEERFLCESIYKRRNGIKALAATSTLAQGMNLPSELVIIGEDSRFDEANDKREILQAQELLNAAGRAGRAGENASGIVLVVPGKVIGFDTADSKIGNHWTALQKIFGQSDQCLTIDDPLTAILDRVHAGLGSAGDIEKYAIARLAKGSDQESQIDSLSGAITSSFGGFLARKNDNAAWLAERIEAAKNFYTDQGQETERELVENQVAASLGLSLELVKQLSAALESDGPEKDATIPTWRRWFFRWLSNNPELIEQVFRPETLADLFGKKKYEALDTAREKAAMALPILSKLVWLWMRGAPLKELELALGTAPKNLKTCIRARRFVLRVIPELSFLFGLPALLHERSQAGEESPTPLPAAMSQLGRCVKNGFNFHEKAALNVHLRRARLTRREIHQHFAALKPHLTSASAGETWEQTLDRLERAMELEINARGE